MRRVAGLMLLAMGFSALLPWQDWAEARDHGVMGQTWPVTEPDLLATIAGRLQAMEANGGIERMQREMVTTARHRVRNPVPVAGITRATEPRNWHFDPSIVVQNDIRDHAGRIIARAGQRANPLSVVAIRRELVFVHGSRPEQIAWAMENHAGPTARIIFVDGSPFDAMGEYQHRFYFDQRGALIAKFGIEHTPAVVRVDGERLSISEIVVPDRNGSDG